LLVRNPQYLERITQFHRENNQIESSTLAKNSALENMLFLFDRYRKVIAKSEFVFVKRRDSREFLFSDSGITAEEPWNGGPVPFDIHVPLTPDLSLEVLPVPDPVNLRYSFVSRTTNEGTTRFNRIAVGSARRFVFSRTPGPSEFVKKYFGVPAPKAYAF